MQVSAFASPPVIPTGPNLVSERRAARIWDTLLLWNRDGRHRVFSVEYNPHSVCRADKMLLLDQVTKAKR